MLFQLLFLTLLLSFLVAKLEINVEGQNGYAKSLPLSGYHLWLSAVMVAVFHSPFLFVPWSVYHELQVLAMIALFIMVEDCLWFLLNPAFGLHKFNKASIPWHKKWVGPVPELYIRMLIGFVVFLGLSIFVS